MKISHLKGSGRGSGHVVVWKRGCERDTMVDRMMNMEYLSLNTMMWKYSVVVTEVEVEMEVEVDREFCSRYSGISCSSAGGGGYDVEVEEVIQMVMEMDDGVGTV